MTQQGFEDYLHRTYGTITGTANSYIKAIHIIDDLFAVNDLFALNGRSLTCINDTDLLLHIADFINEQYGSFKEGKPSFFDAVNSGQRSYPRNGFCTAAMNQLINYHASYLEQKANAFLLSSSNGATISNKLLKIFNIDKEGTDSIVASRVRIGQSYFRKMVLENYEYKCCITGLNVPQTLRASHIVAWAEDKKNRMNPENGLCLSATYDAAFDKHLISFDEDYRMIVSREVKDYYTNDTTKYYFEKFEGHQLSIPKLFLPSKALMEKHRELLVG